MLRQCLLIFGLVILIVTVYFPTRHARHYEYIHVKDIYNQLDFREQESINYNLKNCTYKDVILRNNDIQISSINEKRGFQKPLSGGEFIPRDCKPLMKTAVIIPYRRRTQHLHIFLNYMHPFLQNQNLHYRIFIVDQNDTLPFNRAKMLNYGAKLAIKLKYDCLVLHDVDLIPINSGNIYGCTKMPRHMSSSLDTFRYNLPYLTLFGGAVAIQSEQFKKINGMSNNFYGWGAEDDDFYRRLFTSGLSPCRFSPILSKYTMLPHGKEIGRSWVNAINVFFGQERFKLLKNSEGQQDIDGLNSLSNKYLIELTPLYTHIFAS